MEVLIERANNAATGECSPVSGNIVRESIGLSVLPPLLLLFALTGLLCAPHQQNKYHNMTPGELADQLKEEIPPQLADAAVMADQGAEHLTGDWEIKEDCLSQVTFNLGDNTIRSEHIHTIRFCADGTFSETTECGDDSCGRSVSEGTWAYKNGILHRQCTKGGTKYQFPPESVIWHSAGTVELRYDIDAHKREFISSAPGKVFFIDEYYDKDGYFISEIQQEFYGNRTRNVRVTPPRIMKRTSPLAGSKQELSTQKEQTS